MESTKRFDVLEVPVILHRDGKVLYWNEAAKNLVHRLGIRPGPTGPIGMDSLWQFIAPEERQKATEDYARIMASGAEVSNIRRTIQDTRGRKYRILYSVRPVLWQGEPAILLTFKFLDPLFRNGDGDESATLDDALRKLKKSQQNVAMLAAQGFSVADMASILELSPAAVRQCLDTVYEILGVRSRVELLQLLMGLDSLEPTAASHDESAATVPDGTTETSSEP